MRTDKSNKSFCNIRTLTLILIHSMSSWLIYDWIKLSEDLKHVQRELNLTSRLDQERVMFNRVPKVGSQTVFHLIAELRHRNNFTAITSAEGMPDMPQGETVYIQLDGMRKGVADAIMKQKTPFIFLKHQNYLDFSEFGYNDSSPIYINFVRNPVERIISWYYYIRSPTYQINEDNEQNLNPGEMKMTLEECLSKGFRGCVFKRGAPIHAGGNGLLPSHASQMSFFCGHGKECDKFETEELYKKAIENVDKHYAVIGVLEDWSESLKVLEEFIPRYFAGSTRVFEDIPDIKHVNKNIYKPKVLQEARQFLAEKLQYEMKFYNYCRQKLKRQYLSILN